ncbi:MAG: DUF2231 domain-containing protein [Pseudomonadota bacterium]|nr:DUF2231 domain-containing protein [Pseudomonadota bacterium]
MIIEIIPNWHPVFVHFTVALFSASTGLFILGRLFNKREWAKAIIKAAHINLWLGALATIATVSAGLYAYNTVNHDGPSHMAMTDHKNWAFVTAALFTLVTLWSFKTFTRVKVGTTFLVVLIIATGILAVTAFKGGELVYRYGLGVMSMPQSAGGHDDHGHVAGQEHVTLEDVQEVPVGHEGHDHAH